MDKKEFDDSIWKSTKPIKYNGKVYDIYRQNFVKSCFTIYPQLLSEGIEVKCEEVEFV